MLCAQITPICLFATDALIVEIPRCHRLGRIRNVVLTQAFEILDLVCLIENVFS